MRRLPSWRNSFSLFLLTVAVMMMVVALGCFSFFVSPAQAQEAAPFTARVNATYTVQEDASTRVKLEIRLRNTTSIQYAQQYALQVNSPDVSEVKASLPSGDSLAVEQTKTPLQTVIALRFPEDAPVLGRDQERLFTIEYVSKDTASRYGEVLEVTLPQLADPDFYEQYSVTLVVPELFGEPAWVQPEQFTLDRLNESQVLRFTDVAKTGVSVLFGQEQVYDFQLRYHVANPSQNTGVVEVALPPDTPWQKVWYREITPQPTSLRTDADGNWIAQFRLAGQASQEIIAAGQVRLQATPSSEVPQTSPFLEPDTPWWSRADSSPWLANQSYWQTDHSLVRTAASQNSSAQAIYNFVVETLQYNSQRARVATRVERLGAVGALQDPSNALCQEYTDVFIALARAAGVPARRVTGYAINQNSALRPLSLVADELHAWPEYFDSQQGRWVPVDPTWGDTTGGVDYFRRFDLRHITFARQGVSDVLPLPAGQYKEVGNEMKDVEVNIATKSAVPTQAEVSVRIEPIAGVAWAGQPRRARIVVENHSGLARYTIPVTSQASGAVLSGETQWVIPSLLPYQTVTTELTLSGPEWVQSTPAQLSVNLAGQTEQAATYEFNVRRTISHPILRLVTLGGVVALLSLGAGSVSVFGLRRLRPLRRKSKKS